MAGTTLVTSFELLPNRGLFAAVADEDTLYFAGGNSVRGLELWKTDGTAAGTRLFGNIKPGPADSYPLDLVNAGGKIFLTADDGGHGRELWAILPDAPILVGDYNADNSVDAADYVVWRKSLNASVAPFSGADGSGNGIIDQADYDLWRANFGRTSVPGSGAVATASTIHPVADLQRTTEPLKPTIAANAHPVLATAATLSTDRLFANFHSIATPFTHFPAKARPRLTDAVSARSSVEQLDLLAIGLSFLAAEASQPDFDLTESLCIEARSADGVDSQFDSVDRVFADLDAAVLEVTPDVADRH